MGDITSSTTASEQELISQSLVTNSARDKARAKLLAAGKLVTDFHAPSDAIALSDDELARLGNLPAGTPSSEQLVNEDRGDW